MAIALGWPLIVRHSANAVAVISLTCVELMLPPLFKRRYSRRLIALWVAATIAVAGWGTCILFEGSVDWVRIGFLMPTEARMRMAIGASNLPALLERQWEWGIDDILVSGPIRFLGLNDGLSVRAMLRGIYALMLMICGIAAALHARRGSARVLVALATPWVLMFALLPQMHERHLFWGGVITAIAVGVSFDLAWLHVIVTLLASQEMFRRLLGKDDEFAHDLREFLNRMNPGVAWALLLGGAIFFYQTCKGAWYNRRYAKRAAANAGVLDHVSDGDLLPGGVGIRVGAPAGEPAMVVAQGGGSV
jgi:hypothetical protein